MVLHAMYFYSEHGFELKKSNSNKESKLIYWYLKEGEKINVLQNFG